MKRQTRIMTSYQYHILMTILTYWSCSASIGRIGITTIPKIAYSQQAAHIYALQQPALFRTMMANKQSRERRTGSNEQVLNFALIVRGGDALIEENPDYVEPEQFDTEDYSSSSSGSCDEEDSSSSDAQSEYDCDDENEEEEEDKQKGGMKIKAIHVRKKISRALRSKRRMIRYRNMIVSCLLLYLFRGVIKGMLLYALDHPETITKFAILLRVLFSAMTILSPKVLFNMGDSSSSLSMRNVYTPPVAQHYMFESMNHRYAMDKLAVQKGVRSFQNDNPNRMKENKKRDLHVFGGFVLPYSYSSSNRSGNTNSNNSNQTEYNNVNGTVILMELQPDQEFSTIHQLRDQISFLLEAHRSNSNVPEGESSIDNNNNHADNHHLEVVMIIQSGGGLVQPYALAASQVARLRNEANITLTMCVDMVAASGGYMVACQSSPGQLFAAPFAMVGSIGVVGQTINIHRILEQKGVQTITFKSHEAKAPIGMLGEVTEEGIEHVKEQFGEVYDAFKALVQAARPQIADIAKIATGKVWLGQDALEIGLVDRIITSDEYLSERIRDGYRVFRMKPYQREGILSRALSNSPGHRISLDMLLKSALIGLVQLWSRIWIVWKEEVISMIAKAGTCIDDMSSSPAGLRVEAEHTRI